MVDFLKNARDNDQYVESPTIRSRLDEMIVLLDQYTANGTYREEDRTERLALVACLLAVIPALNPATSDAAAVAGLVMTVLTIGLVSCAGKSLPRFWPGDFFPTFYACHLAVLGILAL